MSGRWEGVCGWGWGLRIGNETGSRTDRLHCWSTDWETQEM
jgi:hypothetical protein